uniref:Lysosomal-associated transmembrane protein 4A n=1 Tax=Plectus sambesii TaxID=2011161 RepID=A0A914UTB3_9BILA
MVLWRTNFRRRFSTVDSDPKFVCCGCCHVLTGTIALGLFNIAVQIVCAGLLIFAIFHPEALVENAFESTLSPLSVPNPGPVLPQTGLIDRRAEGIHLRKEMLAFTRYRVESGDAHLALALVVGLLLITLQMVYGGIKRRPVHLLPFFCFQVFDLIITCLTAVGHYSWLPSIHRAIVESPQLPFREQLMRMDEQYVALVVLLLYVGVLVFKAYMVGVVWNAYQYLHLCNSTVVRFSVNDVGMIYVDVPMTNPDAELLLPPDYETAAKLPPTYPGPPPRYQAESEYSPRS